MKIYLGKYYSISGAAKRAKVKESDLRKLLMIFKIKYVVNFGCISIQGKEVVKINNELKLLSKEKK